MLGQWWFGDEAQQRWTPTLGNKGELPPLKYMDVGAIYIPAESDWRIAPPKFAVWSCMAQSDLRTPQDI